MSKEDVLRVVGQAVECGVTRVQPHLFGESHLHPDYVEILAEIKGRHPGVFLSDTTNGSALTKPEIAEAMYMYLDKLTISLDGASAATINDIRPGLDGADILVGVIDYLKRPDLGQDVVVNTVVMDRNRDEVESIGNIIKAPGRKVGHSCGEVSDLHGHNDVAADLRDATKPCSRPFRIITVNVNGDVILCCRDQHSAEVLGHVDDVGGLEGVWYGDRLSSVMTAHDDGRSGCLDLCSRCTYKGYRREKK